MSSVRVIATFATALLVVAGLGYALSQTVLAREPLVVDRQPQYVEAPQPRATLAPQPGDAPAAPTQVDAAWVRKTARQAGIPAPAVRAYANAQLSKPRGCEVGWTTLAGIGWVESQHGTIGGRTLGDDGHSSTPVLGPALDGRRFAAIRATPESAAWHGDPTWDHAVGPLQFIPSTWETWGADGDGDRVADPNDIDDAAATAVAYLCADGHDLTSGSGWADAVFSYNHSQTYIDDVYAAATAYAERTG